MFVGINLFWNIDSIWELVTHVYALYVRVQILQNISPFLNLFKIWCKIWLSISSEINFSE